MRTKRLRTFVAALLMAAMTISVFSVAGCKTGGTTSDDNKALVMQTSEMDGVYNAFFYSSAYDLDSVIANVQIGLLTNDANGVMVAGNQYATVGEKLYDPYYVDKDGNKTDAFTAGGKVYYDVLLKQGVKYSDGSTITADDVMFNFYTYLDASYDGSATLYTLPIEGLTAYRTQSLSVEESKAQAKSIYDAGYIESADRAQASAAVKAYWDAFDKDVETFAQHIVNYVVSNYADESYVQSNLGSDKTVAQLKASEGLQAAFGMTMWGFASADYTYKAAQADGSDVGFVGTLEEGAYSPEASLAKILASAKLRDKYLNIEKSASGNYVQSYELNFDSGSYVAKLGADKKVASYEEYDTSKTYSESEYLYSKNEDWNETWLARYDLSYAKYDSKTDSAKDRYALSCKDGYAFISSDRAFNGIQTAAGESFTLKGNDVPSISDYFDALKAGYTDDDGVWDIESMVGVEAADDFSPIDQAAEDFVYYLSQAAGTKVESISGLQVVKTQVDGKDRELIRIILTEQNPKAIYDLGITVQPKAYYTQGFDYTKVADKVCNYGVVNGVGGYTGFMDFLKTKNSRPMGAGVYKMSAQNSSGEFVKDNVVYLERNDYFYTVSGLNYASNDAAVKAGANVFNAKIKNIHYQVISSGSEWDTMKTGEVAFATVSATSSFQEEIASSKYKDTFSSISVDNLGYGYICLNPAAKNQYRTAVDGSKQGSTFLSDINVRRAMVSLFDLSEVYTYYPNGLAEIIYRSMSKVNWAYPDDAKAIIEYDNTKTKALQYFKAAGFEQKDGKLVNAAGEQFTITLTLPSEAAAHPAGGIFLNAQTLIQSLGGRCQIKADAQLIANTKSGAVECYALAWQATPDPDMYQVYHWESSADSVVSNGIAWAAKNLSDASLGTVTWNGDSLSQADAIKKLGEYIVEGTSKMTVAERKPIYKNALLILAELCVEIPTYQRKNMYAYNKTIINGSTLSQTVTPYWGPLAEMWKVSFAK